jgi:enoyl-CoA hydratase/carnithine racemase
MKVVINNTFSTINVIDFHVLADLANLIEELQRNDTNVRVVVFSSANTEYFTSHLDVNFFLPGYRPYSSLKYCSWLIVYCRVAASSFRSGKSPDAFPSVYPLQHYSAPTGNHRHSGRSECFHLQCAYLPHCN